MTKSTITRERLEKIKSWRETYGAGSNVMLPAEEAEELARIALAAMDSEPVGYFGRFDPDDEDLIDQCSKNVKGAFPLYRHAQQPVAPEEMTIRDACKFVQDMRLFDDVSVIVMRTWNACRAAILASAQQSPGNEPATVPGKWIPVSEQMPENKPGSYEYLVFETLNNRVNNDYWNVPDKGDEAFTPFWNYYGEHVTHWMPLPAAPQELK